MIKLLTDDGPTERNVAAKVNITGYSQVVQLEDLGDLLETFLELLDLCKSMRIRVGVTVTSYTNLLEVVA